MRSLCYCNLHIINEILKLFLNCCPNTSSSLEANKPSRVCLELAVSTQNCLPDPLVTSRCLPWRMFCHFGEKLQHLSGNFVCPQASGNILSGQQEHTCLLVAASAPGTQQMWIRHQRWLSSTNTHKHIYLMQCAVFLRGS